MPLSLQYDQAEPNSAWSWLQRWSVLRFWEPPVCQRKVSNAKPQKKQGGSLLHENESGKSRRTTRKVSNGDNGAFETDKPKRNPRKATNQQTELVQEQAQSELERVKRSLKKVSTSVTVAPQKPEMETEKPQQQLSAKTVLNSAVPEKETVVSAETPADSDIVVDKISVLEAPSKTEVTVDVPHDDPCLVETHSSENGDKMEKNSVLNDEVSPKGDEGGKEHHKIRKRRSLSSKQEYSENISLNTPSIPSYMAATQSAKAKLRIQGSPKFSEDGAEVGYVRRHSLPASTNGKLGLLSPRIQKPVQANGKGGSKTNRSITTSSRDGKKCNYF